MPHKEEKIVGERLYSGQIFDLEKWQVRLENGLTAEREVILHRGGVGVLVVNEKDEVLLVRQYRTGAGGETLELPAGKRSAGEHPADCGRRELEEECGLVAGHLEPLGTLLPTPAYCSEKIWLYRAVGLSAGAIHLDEDEFITPLWVPLTKALAMVLSGEIEDAKTQIALLKYAVLCGKGADI